MIVTSSGKGTEQLGVTQRQVAAWPLCWVRSWERHWPRGTLAVESPWVSQAGQARSWPRSPASRHRGSSQGPSFSPGCTYQALRPCWTCDWNSPCKLPALSVLHLRRDPTPLKPLEWHAVHWDVVFMGCSWMTERDFSFKIMSLLLGWAGI